MSEELTAIIRFLIAVELLGIVALPLAQRVFGKFPDRGWGFSKIIGILIVAWSTWLLSSLKIISFTEINLAYIVLGVGGVLWIGLFRKEIFSCIKDAWQFILIEELIFLVVFLGWTYLRGYAPDTNGLEKFMDYGFMLSAYKTEYFPPLDHFLARETINYYYFGHYIAAFITKLANILPQFGYNLQMSLIFGLTSIASFSIGSGLFYNMVPAESKRFPWRSCAAGILALLFVGFFGNLHTATHYPFDSKAYWYPDATRFIHNTIHEFPIYSFVVNDLHGHVSDIPFVLLVIGTLSVIFVRFYPRDPNTKNLFKPKIPFLIFLGLVTGVMYATNAWDFAIYLLLSGLILWTINASFSPKPRFFAKYFDWPTLLQTGVESIFLLAVAIITYLPFWINLTPISQGIGFVPPGGQSPLWQLVILWGVQVPLALMFLLWIYETSTNRKSSKRKLLLQSIAKITNQRIQFDETAPQQDQSPQEGTTASNLTQPIYIFLTILIGLSLLLILLPEIIYLKDIYPAHYRANTMFKFYYQAWIMLGVVCGVTVIYLWYQYNQRKSGLFYRIISLLLIFAASIYPVKAIEQGLGVFNKQAQRDSIDGTAYLEERFPADAAAIDWINENIQGQPTFVEAVGESYTDYARIAANTGVPVVLGWPVHEWLWRGEYGLPMNPETQVQIQTNTEDTVSQRVEDVQLFYETDNVNETLRLIDRYGIEYVYIGQFEREKYPNLNTDKFKEISHEVVYDSNNVEIYQIK